MVIVSGVETIGVMTEDCREDMPLELSGFFLRHQTNRDITYMEQIVTVPRVQTQKYACVGYLLILPASTGMAYE
jgi:hypothetical protein